MLEKPVGANPIALTQELSFRAVPVQRGVECEIYDTCLQWVAVQKESEWPSFTCRGCPRYRRVSDEEDQT